MFRLVVGALLGCERLLPLPALLAVRVSPATSGNLHPLGSPPAARPRPNAVTLDTQIVRARFRAPYSVARCARIISHALIAGRSCPFPRNGVRAPCGRPRPATLTKPAPRVTNYVLAGIVVPFRSPRGQNKAGSKQILLFTSGGIFWAFFLLFIDRCRLFLSRTICLFDLVCIEYRNPCLYADEYQIITLVQRWASAFCHI